MYSQPNLFIAPCIERSEEWPIIIGDSLKRYLLNTKGLYFLYTNELSF